MKCFSDVLSNLKAFMISLRNISKCYSRAGNIFAFKENTIRKSARMDFKEQLQRDLVQVPDTEMKSCGIKVS